MSLSQAVGPNLFFLALALLPFGASALATIPGVEPDILPARPQPAKLPPATPAKPALTSKTQTKVVPKTETRVIVQTREIVLPDTVARKKLSQVEEENQRLKEQIKEGQDELERQKQLTIIKPEAASVVPPLPNIVVEPPPSLPPLRSIQGWTSLQVQELQAQTARVLGMPVVGRPCAECAEEVIIPPGKFVMGTLPDDGGAIKERDSRGRTHEVTMSQPLALGKTEVTQAQWRAIMGNNPSAFSFCGRDCPVEEVSWYEVQAYIQRLNARTGLNYRLPTEAEWEYSARAGTTGAFSFGGIIGPDRVNYNPLLAYQGTTEGTWRYMPVVVSSLPANPWGLHEMHGNVAEWVEDCWHDNYDGAPSDGHQSWGRQDGGDCASRVARGGSWLSLALFVRSASRDYFSADDHLNRVGFRLVRTLKVPATPWRTPWR